MEQRLLTPLLMRSAPYALQLMNSTHRHLTRRIILDAIFGSLTCVNMVVVADVAEEIVADEGLDEVDAVLLETKLLGISITATV